MKLLKAAKEIENSIPKKTTFPILNFAAISTEHVGEKDVLKVAATDLSTPKVFTVNQLDGSFPNWDGSIWPDANQKPAMDICLDARLLAAIATAGAKFSEKNSSPIRLRFYSSTSAVRFDLVNDGQEMNGLLMPLRTTDVRPTFKEPAPEPAPDTDSRDTLCPQCGKDDCTCQSDYANSVNEATEVDCHSDADSGL